MGESEYSKTAERTEITHLVATHPEIPGELELNRENREQLAEHMPEYPTKAETQEESRGKEKRRYYTCIMCKKPCKTQIGKTNHLKHSPECRQVPQQEEFANRRQDCRVNFNAPTNYESIDSTYAHNKATQRKMRRMPDKTHPIKNSRKMKNK